MAGAVVLLLSSTALVGSAQATAVTPPAPPYTAFTMHFEGWGLIDGSFSYEASRNTLEVAQQNANGYALVMRGFNGTHWHYFDVTPPIGTRFTAGQSYSTMVNFSPQASTTVLNVSGDGEGCTGTAPGTLNVVQADYDDATGQFTAFAANFSIPCGTGTAKGEIRFQSNIGYKAADSWDYQLAMGDQPINAAGTPHDVTVAVDGTLPTTFGAASLSGADPGAFQISANTCSGSTVSYGSTCTVTITPMATAQRDESALLTLVEDSVAGKVVRLLSLTGVFPRDATASPSSLDFGTVAAFDTSAPQTVTLTGAGALPVTFGTARIVGANPTFFNVTSDGCSGKTLTLGQTCSVTAQARPTAGTAGSASISLPDSSAAGGPQIPMSVNGFTSDRGTYYPMSPYRILDTRSGLGGPHGAVGPGGAVSLQVTGSGGVPADASTVVLNVTVTQPNYSGYITVYPDGVARPNASSLNFTPGWTGANSVTVKVGDNGKVDLFNPGPGSVHLVADVFGYYTKGHACCSGLMGGQYHPLPQPIRLTDTREWGLNTPGGLIPGDAFITSAVDGDPAVLPHIRAFAVNITATQPAGSGFLTAWNGSGSLPGTSTVNYTAGATVPNFAVVPTAPCVDCGGPPPTGADGLPSIGVFTTTATHIIVDLLGYYDDGTVANGLRFSPNVPTRITDTRIGQGWPSNIGPGATASILMPSSIGNADTRGLALNVTGVLPTAPTFLTVWPSGGSRPDTSNLNPTAGTVVPNAVQTGLGSDFKFNVFNAGGFCDVVVDVVGTFYQYPPSTAGSASSQRATAPAPASMKVATHPLTKIKRP